MRSAASLFPAYIQDTTVIEDTGATIDLARQGWRVENYPARLSYSATPSDFGALAVQRRRWANGGLIILPNLLSYLFKRSRRLRNLSKACCASTTSSCRPASRSRCC